MAATTVSLEWLLAQHELGLRLVTGVPAREQLTWAHASDLVDPTPWLTGGELILTTGTGLPQADDEQRAYVGRLAEAGVAGLGFGVGVRYAAIPAPVVAACSERKFPLLEVPLPTPFIAITQAVARRIAQQEVASLQQALTYQRRISRSAIRTGLAGVVSVLSKELRCEAVVLDEYAAVMASSVRQGGLLQLVKTRWDELVPDARRGIVGVTTEHGVLEIQTLRGRAAVVGWLAVQRATPLSPTDRLLLNQAVSLITVQLDWPAELIAAYHSLGGTLLDLLLDPAHDAATLVHHLRHFGFEAGSPVVLVMVTAPRGHKRLLGIVSDTLERASRPHVVSLAAGGVAVLLMARDAADLTDVLDHALHGVGKVAIGASGSIPQTAAARGVVPAELAAAAARREQRRIGWFDDLTLSAVLADEEVRSRVWTLARPALDALVRDAAPRETDLVASLEAFLQHNGSWEAAARALGVHRHTLRARMSRVEELTGLSLDVAENRVMLLLGLMSRPNGLMTS
jgi:purine catabolism regulator